MCNFSGKSKKPQNGPEEHNAFKEVIYINKP